MITPCLRYFIESRDNLFKVMFGSCYLVYILFLIYRVVDSLMNPVLRHVFTPNKFEEIFLFVICIFMIISGFGFLLLMKEKQDKEIQKLIANKDRFFSIIAHDLRDPISAVASLSEVLSENAKEYTLNEIHEITNLLRDSSKNSFRLLENLLDWSRVQMKIIEFKPEPIVLDTLIRETIELVKNVAITKNIKLTYHNNADSVELVGDSNMLHTILRNLITNAIKFTPKAGTITIQTVKNKTQLKISVTDNGIGMDADLITKLFKINEKTSRLGTDNETGTGLGLLLCSEFVGIHGGIIWAESESGKGSTFTFALPIS